MSLNPIERSDEVAGIGMWDGLMSGACGAIPSGMAVWYGSHYSPNFIKYTNHQSRTAMFIMPPLFMFALASEQKITQRMRQMAEEKDHSNRVTEWAEDQQQQHKENIMRRIDTKLITTNNTNSTTNIATLSDEERERQLSEIYRKSVENSGIRIVPGDSLGLHHRVANFWQENPFKILVAMSVPTVAYIFKGRSGQSHLKLQSMIMQTRVFGQFSVIFMLLTLMGFKGYMDVNGKFVTETSADRQMEDMRAARDGLLDRLARDRSNSDRLEQLKARAKVEMDEEKKETRKRQRKDKKNKKVKEGVILVADE